METPNIPYKQANIYEIMKITLIDFTHLPSLKKKVKFNSICEGVN